MQPSTLTIHEIFEKERRYTVPLFQRAYVWTLEDQWEPLWEDVERQAESCLTILAEGGQVQFTHFLGAVVLNVAKVLGRGLSRSEVIDGQQRLTTLQILLAALRDYARETGDEVAYDLERLTLNPVKDPTSVERFKVWPTNADRDVFGAVMSAGGPDALVSSFGGGSLPRMVEAYKYFYERIRAFVEGDQPSERHADRLYALLHAFKTSLQVVVIELEDRDDPQVIFETLNARGQPLLPSDLIRNTVFLEASAKGMDADELYTTHWRPFDETRTAARGANGEDRFWHLEERQGRLIRPRIDLFMFHDLTVRTERELNIGRLFREFRDWYSRSGITPELYLASVNVRAEDFARLLDPQGGDRLSVFAQRLRSLDTSTVYPILLLMMELSRKGLPLEERNQAVTDLESYLVRRFVCQMTTKNYNSFFLGLLRRMAQAGRDGENVVSALREELLRPDGPAVVWPSDVEFRNGWISKPVYVKSRPDRSAMVLKALNEALHSSKNESITIAGELTVEHLLPQSPDLTDYPYPSDHELPLGAEETLEARRQRLTNTVGNLTLLTQPLNSSVSNGPFPDKLRKIASDSDLRLNAHFRDLAFLEPAQPAAAWNEAHIQQRSEKLLQTALEIWPRPQ